MNKKLRVLALVAHYLPGYKAGGPLRTISNMVEHLGDEFDFYILTSDRDATDVEPYPDIEVGQWVSVGKAQVCYLPSHVFRNPLALRRFAQTIDFDVAYINSFFATQSVSYVLSRRLGLLRQIPLIVAPRGEFSIGAIRIKSLKKRLYLRVARMLKLYDGALWQASSPFEKADIAAVCPTAATHIAPDLLPKQYGYSEETTTKMAGSTRIAFLSRITPKKNLHTALEILRCVNVRVSFDIYGTIRNTSYWKRCEDLIKGMPDNVMVTYKGELSHDQVVPTLSQYHLFFLPTLGENFGHAIIEALNAGCLVLLSDQTPWRHLEKEGVGWDISLDRIDQFVDIIDAVGEMDDAEFQQSSQRARTFGLNRLHSKDDIEANRNLFYLALNGHS